MDKVWGVVRTIVAAGFGYLAGKGYIDGSTVDALAGAVVVLLTAVWSIWEKTNTKPAS